MTFKEKFWAWYDAHIGAGWYKKSSIYVAGGALLLPAMQMMVQAVIDNWSQVAVVLKLSPFETMVVQIVFAVIVVPAVAAWKQRSVREAVLKQAVKTGEVTSSVKTDAVVINVEGTPPVVVAPQVPA